MFGVFLLINSKVFLLLIVVEMWYFLDLRLQFNILCCVGLFFMIRICGVGVILVYFVNKCCIIVFGVWIVWYFVGYQIDDLFGDICYQIVYVFYVFCNEMQMYIGCDILWIFYYECQEFMEQCVVYLINVLVVLMYCFG